MGYEVGDRVGDKVRAKVENIMGDGVGDKLGNNVENIRSGRQAERRRRRDTGRYWGDEQETILGR